MRKEFETWTRQLEDLKKKIKDKGLSNLSRSQRYRLGVLRGMISGYKKGLEDAKSQEGVSK